MHKHSILPWITAAALVIVSALPAQTATNGSSGGRRYRIVDLGPLVGPPAMPYAIANTGLAAGAARNDANSPLHAVLWYRGISFDIGQRGLDGPNKMANGLNDSGQAVGSAVAFSSVFPYSWQVSRIRTDRLIEEL